MVQEAQYLSHTPVEEVETTLLILPNALPDFLDYLDFMDEAGVADPRERAGGRHSGGIFPPIAPVCRYKNRMPRRIIPTARPTRCCLLREESIEHTLEHYKDPKRSRAQYEKMREFLQGVRKLMEE